MSWSELVTLAALVLVSGFFLSFVFQWIKSVFNVKWRPVALWVVCIIVALAQSWLAGNILGIVGELNAGIATATDVFAFGSATFAAATAIYNLYVGPRAAARKAASRR